MTKLKTLKDSPFNVSSLCYQSEEVYLMALKEAAKEWRAYLFDKVCTATKNMAEKNIIPITEIVYYMAQIHWIDHFFDWEDEDK